MKSIFKMLAALMFIPMVLVGCTDADMASQNLSKDADYFKIPRRIVFYNGITDSYVLEVTGYCSLDGDHYPKITVTCKTPEGYKKNYLWASDNVTAFAEQLDPVKVSTSFYKVNFKPSAIIPNIEFH